MFVLIFIVGAIDLFSLFIHNYTQQEESSLLSGA